MSKPRSSAEFNCPERLRMTLCIVPTCCLLGLTVAVAVGVQVPYAIFAIVAYTYCQVNRVALGTPPTPVLDKLLSGFGQSPKILPQSKDSAA
jgi:hypothetical protein